MSVYQVQPFILNLSDTVEQWNHIEANCPIIPVLTKQTETQIKDWNAAKKKTLFYPIGAGEPDQPGLNILLSAIENLLGDQFDLALERAFRFIETARCFT